jgi:7,8-dihydropterin-6-yl-methyl-4-(beta-D-ribofuranosyl)aminobenzene 5'-phosphate synthase
LRGGFDVIQEPTQIAIVVNNVASAPELMAEHGFSLSVRRGALSIIFDTGQERAVFENNVQRLGIDLREVGAVVLSHGHYDHTGGLPAVLEVADAAQVYAHPAVLNTRYSVRPERIKSNGMPPESGSAIQRLSGGRLHWIGEPLRLTDSAGITGFIPRESGFEDTGGPFYFDREGITPDPVDDDQALWLMTAAGLIVCAGCSHAGIVNTLNYVRRISGCEKIRAVIGGLHLVNASEERIEKTLAALDAFNPELIVPCHCSGAAATERILAHFGDRAAAGRAGVVFRFV